MLSRVDNEAVRVIESFMKNEFSISMIVGDNPQISDYLGKYQRCQQKFCFSIGHKIILKLIVEHCAEQLGIASPFEKPLPLVGIKKRVESKDQSSNENENTEDDQCYEQPTEFDKLGFFRYIGSLMIDYDVQRCEKIVP